MKAILTFVLTFSIYLSSYCQVSDSILKQLAPNPLPVLDSVEISLISDSIMKQLGPNPLLFLDSVEISLVPLQEIAAKQISNITILLPKTAKKKIGQRATDGAIFVTTIEFAKKSYASYFSGNYKKYSRILQEFGTDSLFGYVINDIYYDNKYTSEKYSSIVTGIKKFRIINKTEYEHKYNVLIPQKYVIIIKTKKNNFK